MNIELGIINKVGIFGRFVIGMRSLMASNQKIDDIENLYFYVQEREENPFDWVFDQTKMENPDKKIISTINPRLNTYKNLFGDKELLKLRRALRDVKIKDSLLERINPDIDEKTIGIHIRLTDMNVFHGHQHGNFLYGDFRNKLVNVMKTGQYDKIYVASDNDESIEKLKKEFDIIYYDGLINRSPTESEGRQYNKRLKNNHYTQQYWEESYLEMLSLARCGGMITRLSNLNNAAIMFSRENLKHVYGLTKEATKKPKPHLNNEYTKTRIRHARRFK